MVRLKEPLVDRVLRPLRHFNSSMVRLKEVSSLTSSLRQLDFNSSMVRLKAPGKIQEYEHAADFNSSMVRLKVLFSPIKMHPDVISIPVWYD